MRTELAGRFFFCSLALQKPMHIRGTNWKKQYCPDNQRAPKSAFHWGESMKRLNQYDARTGGEDGGPEQIRPARSPGADGIAIRRR
jgi:hypothetical protein